ncbi:MAG: RDD family protein [Alphaproteobacteria bacterium]|uniref:RDD family protein n=1 Tax=Candidatus Nitrobium versatile TaxID=2884831 RepID=A0A953JDV6_9BACT|nr:RDD family protein [Candidatus Nitrobium versatile]
MYPRRLLTQNILQAHRLYLGFFSKYNSHVVNGPLDAFFRDIHLILIPTFLGLLSSSIFHGRSPGARLMNIRVISHSDHFTSVIGNVLRSFLLLAPPYIYFHLVLMPYSIDQVTKGASFPFVEPIIFLMLALVIPFSILWGAGRQGFHDRLLCIHVEEHHCSSNLHLPYYSPFSVLGTLFTTLFVSYLIVLAVHYSSFINKKISQLLPAVNHYNDRTQLSKIEALNKKLNPLLVNPPLNVTFLDSGLFYQMHMIPKQARSGVIIPEYVSLPILTISVDGNGLRQIKQLTLELGNRLRAIDIGSDYYMIRVYREAQVDLFRFIVEAVCLYKKHAEAPEECYTNIGAGPTLLSWTTGLYSRK